MGTRLRCVLCGIILSLTALGAWAQSTPFAVETTPAMLELQPGDSTTLTITLRVPPDHYLYQEETDITFTSLEGFQTGAFHFPPSREKLDEFSGIRKQVWENDVVITIPVIASAQASAQRAIAAAVSFQGCSPELCFRRETVPVEWPVAHSATATRPRGTNNQGPGTASPERRHDVWSIIKAPAEHVFQHGWLLTYLLVWIGGVLTGFTPCVLPMLPVVLLIIGVTPDRRRRNFVLASCLAAGLALTYALIGAVGVVLGLPIGFLFGQRWVLLLVILFFLAMAASMFGLFHLQLPSRLQTRLNRLGGHGLLGAFLAGISTGILATPCAGPVVAALVAHSSVQQDLLRGFTLLLTYGLGLGALFVGVGTFFGHLAGTLPRGRVALWFKRGLGVLLLLPALYYGWALLEPPIPTVPFAIALAQAERAHKPLLLEFTSKTCLPCIRLEQTTLQDDRVRAALAERIIPVRIDTTFSTPENEALVTRYRVVGWPTLLFLTPNGTVQPDLTVVGRVISAGELLARIARAAEAASAAPGTSAP